MTSEVSNAAEVQKELVEITRFDKKTRTNVVKQYETVQSRVRRFREDHGETGWFITTEIISVSDDVVILKAAVGYIAEGGNVVILATGHAEEWRASSQINSTSAIENAETSAIGRALAALGYMATDSFASANEVQNAMVKGSRLENARAGALALLQEAASRGSAALEECWKNRLEKPDRVACRGDLPELKRQAEKADGQPEQSELPPG